MSKYHIEIVISEGESSDGSDWKIISDIVVDKNDEVESKGYPLEMLAATLNAVKGIRKELTQEETTHGN